MSKVTIVNSILGKWFTILPLLQRFLFDSAPKVADLIPYPGNNIAKLSANGLIKIVGSGYSFFEDRKRYSTSNPSPDVFRYHRRKSYLLFGSSQYIFCVFSFVFDAFKYFVNNETFQEEYENLSTLSLMLSVLMIVLSEIYFKPEAEGENKEREAAIVPPVVAGAPPPPPPPPPKAILKTPYPNIKPILIQLLKTLLTSVAVGLPVALSSLIPLSRIRNESTSLISPTSITLPTAALSFGIYLAFALINAEWVKDSELRTALTATQNAALTALEIALAAVPPVNISPFLLAAANAGALPTRAPGIEILANALQPIIAAGLLGQLPHGPLSALAALVAPVGVIPPYGALRTPLFAAIMATACPTEAEIIANVIKAAANPASNSVMMTSAVAAAPEALRLPLSQLARRVRKMPPAIRTPFVRLAENARKASVATPVPAILGPDIAAIPILPDGVAAAIKLIADQVVPPPPFLPVTIQDICHKVCTITTACAAATASIAALMETHSQQTPLPTFRRLLEIDEDSAVVSLVPLAITTSALAGFNLEAGVTRETLTSVLAIMTLIPAIFAMSGPTPSLLIILTFTFTALAAIMSCTGTAISFFHKPTRALPISTVTTRQGFFEMLNPRRVTSAATARVAGDETVPSPVPFRLF